MSSLKSSSATAEHPRHAATLLRENHDFPLASSRACEKHRNAYVAKAPSGVQLRNRAEDIGHLVEEPGSSRLALPEELPASASHCPSAKERPLELFLHLDSGAAYVTEVDVHLALPTEPEGIDGQGAIAGAAMLASRPPQIVPLGSCRRIHSLDANHRLARDDHVAELHAVGPVTPAAPPVERAVEGVGVGGAGASLPLSVEMFNSSSTTSPYVPDHGDCR